jgi:diguanylate cyclase (GGDEF)-like protein
MTDDDNALAPRRPSRSTRPFAIASALGVGVALISLLVASRTGHDDAWVHRESEVRADLAQAMARGLWPEHGGHLTAAGGLGRQALLGSPAHARLDAQVRRQLDGKPGLWLAFLDLDGRTVYATASSRIGEDRSRDEGFRAALDGRVHGALQRADADGGPQAGADRRDIVVTHVPLRPRAGDPVLAVAEIRSDVTGRRGSQAAIGWTAVGLLAGLFAALHLGLVVRMRRTERLLARQVREREVAEARIAHQARHDALTGLPNRPVFVQVLDEALLHGEGALMLVDLDRLKAVNDSLGLASGDEVLRTMAERLRHAIPPEDRLFRLGGDEFAVVVRGTAEPLALAHRARRLTGAAGEPLRLLGEEIAIGASVGIARFPHDGETADLVVRRAAAAVMRAKQAGRATHVAYEPAMDADAVGRLSLETQALAALRRGEFILHYQPRLDSSRRELVAVEALLRWQHPTLGLLPPGEFIDALESAGLMQAVGEWVLRAACAQQQLWIGEGLRPVRMAVNVSASQFQQAGFADTVARVVADTGIAAGLLELELTESLLVTQPRQARETLKALKALGVRTSIDDFGTGYSSLSYLREFAVDCVKIDRSFVADVADHPRDRAVARAIIDLAQALGIEVVAEGIETEAQAAFFTEARCHELQGWLFSRAKEPHALAAWMSPKGPAPGEPPSRREAGPSSFGGLAPQFG